jgi:hypothetical protein
MKIELSVSFMVAILFVDDEEKVCQPYTSRFGRHTNASGQPEALSWAPEGRDAFPRGKVAGLTTDLLSFDNQNFIHGLRAWQAATGVNRSPRPELNLLGGVCVPA